MVKYSYQHYKTSFGVAQDITINLYLSPIGGVGDDDYSV